MSRILCALGLLTMVAGCGDPLRNVARLSDVQQSQGTQAQLTGVAPAQGNDGGLISNVVNGDGADPTVAVVDAALAQARMDTPAGGERRGLFGLFGGNNNARAERDLPADAPTVTAVSAPVATPSAQRRGGLFSGLGNVPNPDAPDSQEVSAGTRVPFGTIARVCDLTADRQGRAVDNVGGAQLYDSSPNSTAMRPFYLTGLRDRCARTFSGALVIQASPTEHEFIRYESRNDRPYSTVDRAYEDIRSRICRVGPREPCTRRADRLERDVQFLTAYRTFGPSNSWVEILIYKGRIEAISLVEE